MLDTLSVPPSPELATTNTTNADPRSGRREHPPTHSSLPSSTSVAHLSPTFPTHHAPLPSVRSTTAAASATAQPSPSSSSAASTLSPSHNETSPATTSSAVAVRMDASPVILFTLQYSVAVVQGVTIYILSVVFSILQLVSGQLNDGSPPSSSSRSSAGSPLTTSAFRKKSGDEERRQQRQQQRRRRRWSGSGINNSTRVGTTAFSTLTTETSTSSVRGWAQNLIIAHTQSQSNPAEGSANAEGGGEGGAGTLAQRVEVLRFLGSTIASLVGSYARPTSSSTAFSSASGEGVVESKTTMKRQLSSSLSKSSGAAAAGGEMNYSSRIRRALVKTLSGHAIPLPRSIKRVTFNDTLQFHTTTTTTITNRRPRARFGDEDEDEDEEVEDEDETDSTNSSPVLRFFSAGFGGASGVALSPEEPMSTSPSPSTPLPFPGEGSGKKVKKNRPPSIMPSARDRRQLQDQDDLEDLAAVSLQQQEVRSGGVLNVVSNGRSIPVSTTTTTPGTSTIGKKLVSTITIALPPLSRPRKQQLQLPLPHQQQQLPQTPASPMFSIAASSASSAAGAATTSTTTTTTTSMTMTVPTSFTPSSGTSGLASALLSSLMMPAVPGPVSDAARSLLTSTSTSTPTSAPPMIDTFAPALSDSDSSKSSTGRGGHLKRTRSAPSKISTFLQQHRLTRQQQQQQQSGQMQGQGLFSPGEYTSSPRDLVSSPKSVSSPTMTGFVKSTTTKTTTASTASATDTQGSSCTTTALTVNVNVRARQPSASSTSSTSTTTTTLVRPKSLHSIQSSVSSAVAAVIIGTGVPPPSVPTSLTTSMSRSLSPPRLGPTTMATTTTTTFLPTHQRRRSASIDLGMSVSNVPSSFSSSKEDLSAPGTGSAVDITPMGSGGRSLMYKLTHPQRYKRELELQLQSQSQRDTSSLSSAASSPSASQVTLPSLSPTFSPTNSMTSIQGTLQPESSSSSSATKVVYPFSRSFTDLPASLSYLSDDPHPAHLPPPHTYTPASASVSVSVDNSLSPSSSTTNVAASEEIYQPQPLSLNTPLPPVGDKEGIPAVVRESTTPPLSMFFPSPTSQHRAPLPSPTLALSSMKDTLAQLRRSPSPRPRRSATQDEDGASSVHTTFAACGFSISPSSS